MNKYIVSYTDKATADLINLKRFIALDNPREANKYISNIMQKIDLLTKFPELGKKVTNKVFKNLALRALVVGNCSVLYRVIKSNIQIIHVYRHSQDWETLLFADPISKPIKKIKRK